MVLSVSTGEAGVRGEREVRGERGGRLSDSVARDIWTRGVNQEREGGKGKKMDQEGLGGFRRSGHNETVNE